MLDTSISVNLHVTNKDHMSTCNYTVSPCLRWYHAIEAALMVPFTTVITGNHSLSTFRQTAGTVNLEYFWSFCLLFKTLFASRKIVVKLRHGIQRLSTAKNFASSQYQWRIQVSLFALVSVSSCWDLVHSGCKCKIAFCGREKGAHKLLCCTYAP